MTEPADGIQQPVTQRANVAQLRKPTAESRQRLVVELNRAVALMLDELVELEGTNKTTVVNRAIHAYHMLRLAQEEGGQVLLARSGTGDTERIRFL